MYLSLPVLCRFITAACLFVDGVRWRRNGAGATPSARTAPPAFARASLIFVAIVRRESSARSLYRATRIAACALRTHAAPARRCLPGVDSRARYSSRSLASSCSAASFHAPPARSASIIRFSLQVGQWWSDLSEKLLAYVCMWLGFSSDRSHLLPKHTHAAMSIHVCLIHSCFVLAFCFMPSLLRSLFLLPLHMPLFASKLPLNCCEHFLFL